MVVGHQATELKSALSGHSGLTFVVQAPQLGTAHALLTAEPALAGRRGTVVMLYADVPMLTSATVTRLLDRHTSAAAAATVLTADVDNPYGYGRIVRDGVTPARRNGKFEKSTPVFMPSRSTACSMRSGRSRRITRRVSITFPISSPSTGGTAEGWRR
jgi:CTP:molybdopterin cytidylyltransferase MocA